MSFKNEDYIMQKEYFCTVFFKSLMVPNYLGFGISLLIGLYKFRPSKTSLSALQMSFTSTRGLEIK